MGLRTRIIHLLGGWTWDDISPGLQAQILQEKSDQWLSERMRQIFLSDVGRPIYTVKK